MNLYQAHSLLSFMKSEIANDLLLRSCCHLFPKSGSSNIKHLVLIPSCLARGGLKPLRREKL